VLAAAAAEPGPGRDEVVVVAPHLEGGTAAGRQLHPLDHRTAVGKQLGLDLGTGAELAIEALMAAAVLLQQLGFNRHPGEVGHQLHMAPVDIAPGQPLGAAEDVEATARPVAGHHGGAEQLHLPQQPAHLQIELGDFLLFSQTGGQIQLPQLAQQLSAAGRRTGLGVLPPEAPIGVENHQQTSLRCHQPGGDQGNQLQEAVQVGEAAQRKAEGGEQLLVAPLLATEAVEQLPQRSRRREGLMGPGRWLGHAGWRAARNRRPQGPNGSSIPAVGRFSRKAALRRTRSC
jgi:hypothetical protein